MRASKLFSSLAAAGLVALAAASAHAAIVVPFNTWSSSSFPGYDDSFAIDDGANHDITDWASNGDGAGAWLRLDLGDTYTLDKAFVTDRTTSGGGNNTKVLGLFDFTTKYSIQGFTDASFTTAIAPALVFNHAAPAMPTATTDFLSTANLGGLTARYVQYNVLATNGRNPGLADIRFSTVVAGAPEPMSWALMIVGFGGMGVMLRRRRALALAHAKI